MKRKGTEGREKETKGQGSEGKVKDDDESKRRGQKRGKREGGEWGLLCLSLCCVCVCVCVLRGLKSFARKN
jgi:hypothetical protein